MVLVAFKFSSFGADKIWDGGGTGGGGTANDWNNAGNWDSNIAPVNGDDVIFGIGFTSGTTVDLNGNRTANSLSITSATAIVIGDTVADVLTLSSGNISSSSSANQNITSIGIALGASGTWSVTGAGSLTVNGIINDGAGSFGITKTGAGNLILSGVNTYDGNTRIGAGTLTIGGTTALQNSTLDMNGADAGLLSFGSQTSATFGGLTGSRTVALTNASGAAVTLSVGNNGGNDTFSGILTGSGAVTKVGAGTFIVTGANNYSGVTTVSAGTLQLGTATALGTTAGNTVVSSGATLDLNGQVIGNEAVTINGAGVGSGGVLINSSGTDASLSGAVTLGSASTVGGAGNTTLTGAIGGGANTLTKVGSGTVTLGGSSANTYTGVTTVNDGTVTLSKSSGNAIAGNLTVGDGTGTDTVQFTGNNQIADTSAVTVNSSGVLNLNNNSDRVGSLTVSGGSVNIGTGTLTNAGNISMTAGSVASTGVGKLLVSGDVGSAASANAATISGNLDLGNATRTFTVANGAAADDLVVSAVVANGGITKAGAGMMVLSGANTYSGVTTIGAGVLRLDNASALGGGNLTLNGGVLGLGAGDFTRALGTGAGQVQWTASGGFAAYGDDRIVNIGGAGATLSTSSTTLFGNASADFLILSAADATHTVTFVNGINFNSGSGARTIQVDDGAATVDAIISGQIQGSTTDWNKTGAGRLELTGNNNFTTILNVNAGVVRASSATAFGTTANGSTIASGAAIELNGNISIGAEALSLNGTGISGAGALRNVGGSNTWAGAVTLADFTATHRINSDAGALALGAIGETGNNNKTLALGGSGNIVVAGVISGGVDMGLLKDGTGTAFLNGANTYAMGTTVSNGVLVLNNATALPGGIGVAGGSSALTISGGVVGLGAGDFTRGLGTSTAQVQWTGSGGFAAFGANRNVNLGGASATVTWGSGSFVPTGSALILGAADATHTVTFQNPIALGSAARTVQVNDGAANVDAVLSGHLSGTGSLVKSGAGNLSVTASNSYSGGTTVNGGKLSVNNTTGSGTGSGAVTVNNGGVLGGGGSVSSTVALNSGSAISPGNSVGKITTGSETWNGGASYIFELKDVDLGEGLGGDLIDVTGGINVAATSGNKFGIEVRSLTLGDLPGAVNDFDASQSYIWRIAKSVTGLSFALGESEATVFQLLLGDFTSYNDTQGGTFGLTVSNGGKDLNLTFTPAAVPEPGTWALMLLGGAGFAFLRRRRRQ